MNLTMRKIIGINKNWYLTWRNFQYPVNEDLLTGSTKGWLKAKVPGDVHTDLFSAGEIPDPYFGLNADLCRWVEEKDWCYRCDFKAPKLSKNESVFLVFNGIDTFATIFLNGEEIAHNRNMFTPVRVKVTDKIKPGRINMLLVKVASPIFSVQIKDKTLSDFYLPRVYARKAQFNYGWDIAPHMVSTGIWQPVSLEIVREAAISDFYIQTLSWDEETANLTAQVRVDIYQDNFEFDLNLKIFSAEGKLVREIAKRCGRKRNSIPFQISPFQFWWPNGTGTPYLYRSRLTLSHRGKIIDRIEHPFGIRKIELIQEKISDRERSFYFRINGKRIFIKGFNWSPSDTFPGTISPERYRTLLRMVKETGANMIRVWGGGIYEPEIFYKTCSKLGIMVWQDFMFACAGYPEDTEFLREVEKEAEVIVQRLRKHACLSLWCGGNENEHIGGRTHRIGREILNRICQKLDPATPYIIDSPFDPSGKEPNTCLRGDSHLWAHGKSYRDDFYLKDTNKFVSEIGHLSVPDRKTLLTFLPKEKLWPPFNEYWHYHSSDTLRSSDTSRNFFFTAWIDRISSLFETIKNNRLPRPKNLAELIKATQTLQAKAYQVWSEHCYNQPNCGGILIWNVCDCWPQISDSIINHNLKPKKAYYAVRKTFLKLTKGEKCETK